MAEKENIHKGHRQRMMKKFLEYGIGCFEEHEVLEILLYSCYTRRNTNDIAHELINTFGSLRGVLNADHSELCRVPNVGHNAAATICFLRQLSQMIADNDMRGTVLKNSEDMRQFCYKLLGGCNVEVAHALFLDEAYAFVDDVVISRGSHNMVGFDLKRIVSKAMELQCTKVILAHNHPQGISIASAADVASTRRVANALNNLGIDLLDHIILNEEGAYSMRTARLLQDIWEV